MTRDGPLWIGVQPPARHVICPHCEREIDVASGQFGGGQERATPTNEDRAKQRTNDRYEDVNQSTRPGDVNLADLKKGRI